MPEVTHVLEAHFNDLSEADAIIIDKRMRDVISSLCVEEKVTHLALVPVGTVAMLRKEAHSDGGPSGKQMAYMKRCLEELHVALQYPNITEATSTRLRTLYYAAKEMYKENPTRIRASQLIDALKEGTEDAKFESSGQVYTDERG
jgi:hypothetical protein